MGQDFLKLGKLKQGSQSDGMRKSNEISSHPKYPKESHLIFFWLNFREVKTGTPRNDLSKPQEIFKPPKFLIIKPQKFFKRLKFAISKP